MKFKESLKKHPIWYGAAVIIVVGGAFYFLRGRNAAASTQYATATASKQTIVSSVNGTGQISNLKKLDLKPQTSGTQNQGTLIQMNVVPSQKVKAGDVIAVIDDSSARVSLEQARAALTSAQANYDKVAAGTTATDLNSAQQDVTSAESALQNAKNNLQTVIDQQNAAVANALRNLLGGGIAAVQAQWPYTSPNVAKTDAPTISGSYTGTATGTYHIIQQGSYFSVNGIETQALQKFDTKIPVALGTNGLYVQFPNDQISAEWDVIIPNPQSSNYASNLSAYQSALLNQKQSVSNAQNSVTNAQTSLQKVEDSLSVKKQPPTASDIASARAQLINAQSNYHNAQNNLNNTRIIAPFDGIIAEVNSQKGDQVSGSTAVATLVTDQKIATVSLNEVDAAKVKVGDQATLTFSAIPNLTIAGKVTQVDVLGTISQGVVNYNVQIGLDSPSDQILPGMSVNASIITDTIPDALAVPSAAVKTSNGQSYVLVVDPASISSQSGGLVTLKNDPVRQVVEIGGSNDTMTEITSGLTEGQTVVTRTVTSGGTNSGNSGGGASSLRIPGITGGGGGGNVRFQTR